MCFPVLGSKVDWSFGLLQPDRSSIASRMDGTALLVKADMVRTSHSPATFTG
jgi:hypothetical protein